ncbi:WXG100 family type VII secretion target [Oryzobacter sp. R7]|uniref:WXG100 family type VII secretion target n=1 Tax=Oryzobacter faecalis TaxID=3388656 RepID=UPI00398CCB42
MSGKDTIMSGGIKVGGAGIDTLVNDMKKGLTDLEQRLETMKGDLKPYVEQWDGSARQAYSQAQKDWDQQIEDCKLLLEDVRQAVIRSKEDYLAGELRNTNMWG